jgi:hypothetical protein
MSTRGPFSIYNLGANWGILIYYFSKFLVMGRKIAVDFVAHVQSKDNKLGRKIIELPVAIRDNFATGIEIKVRIEKV